MRRPPRGGRRMERVHRKTRGATAMECVSERIPEQLSRENCPEIRSEMHSAAAAPRMSRFAHSMRQPPCG
eukprot:3991802-Lingulodinium_polyedra.AAC.1